MRDGDRVFSAYLTLKGEKLWVTANNYLYTFYTSDLPDKPASHKKTILTDKNKAWNPFGMFVLEWGPDDKLYMSVGNHGMELQGPEGQKVNSRGGSGIIVRMICAAAPTSLGRGSPRSAMAHPQRTYRTRRTR